MLVLTALLLAANALLSWKWLRDAAELSHVKVVKMTPHDDEVVVTDFLQLLAEASVEIVMYDDGDTSPESLYQDRRAVDALRDRLVEDPDFTIDCVLNDRNGETLFESALEGLPNVRIRSRASNPRRVHYKIIDRRKAYVSCHDVGQKTRGRKLIDCTDVPLTRGRTPIALRRYFDDFERHAAVA